ncbi:uncharacterized protein N7479_002789 [Penicillium vulpinum]|uniref:F-box domain-containing protein n=1 Tax=Penicillium vulpinum TaxID=29845 RepID=A0A1V6RU20_9EURO|nr:uncharacterized protein N7479_002789 [Penicillium vulpinum]KAJ5972871.1 hypothetical protein N7479_002789 [Penicillium vulpinum]OQE05078.1 hypothetical protein PENVUL_c027G03102 [Penicillium vulpinum]
MHIHHSAQTRALAIPEIVISILHQMDMDTLIAAQRVCHAWADPIRRLRSLQKALFFIPDSDKSGTNTRVYNPLLARVFDSAFPSEDLRGPSNAKGCKVTENMKQVALSHFDLAKSPTKREIYLRPEASWRRMLTQQPPILTVGQFSTGTGPMGLNWHQKRAARQDEGLRMGTLFEWLVNLGRYKWNDAMIAICLGGAEPLNTPPKIMGPSTYLFADNINEDWRIMCADFDLMLMTGTSSSCTDFEPDDPDYEKSTDEVVWEEICETYSKLGLTVAGLKMEEYNEGFEWWD